jgi:hypothetical protein
MRKTKNAQLKTEDRDFFKINYVCQLQLTNIN